MSQSNSSILQAKSEPARGNDRRRVLVLEKDLVTAAGHASLLRQAGYESSAISSASDVLDLKHPPLVLVTDIPDTLESAGVFVPGEKRAPLVLVLGPDKAINAVQAMRKGAYNYLPLPLEAGTLRKAVEEAEQYAEEPTLSVPLLQNPLNYVSQSISHQLEVRKRTEKALLNQSKFLKTLLSSLPTPVFYKDTRGIYLGCNQAYCEFLGISSNGIIGKTVYQCWPPELAAIYATRDSELLESGGYQDYEGPLMLANGELRDVIFKKSVFHLADGTVGGIIGLIMDTTRRKLLEDALQDARRRADAANRAKSEFLASMSHEIRTPLGAVLGMADLLKRSPLNGEQQRYLNILTQAGENLLELIQDILDLSNIETGKLSLSTVPVSPVEIARTICTTMIPACEKKGLKLSCEIDNHMPVLFLGDPLRIRQIMTSLVGNAVKFTKTGQIHLSLEYDQETGEILFSVSDTGVGIPLDKQLDIFDRFTQADTSSTRQFDGSGLGLAICRSLCIQMGGRIWLDSAPGQGSTFHVALPLPPVRENSVAVSMDSLDGKASRAARKDRPQRACSTPTCVTPLRLLVIEDSEYMRELYHQYLKATPHRLRLATNPRDGLRLITNEPFDLVFLDLQMPSLDGFEILRSLREWERTHKRAHTDVIAVSGDTRNSSREHCLDSGFDGFLAKPLHQDQFFEILHRHANQDTKSGTTRQGLRCLLADESDVMRLIIGKVLREFGCDKILEARDGAEVLKIARSQPLDCIICDWNMPRMKGGALLRSIRELPGHADTPCVLLTAGATEESRQEALRLGASACLPKPFRLEQLKNELARFIRRRG